MSRMSHVAIVLTLLVLVGAACGGGTNDLADEPTTMPATTVTTAALPTLASMPGGGLVHGDPDGRFSLPLVGDWAPVVSADSYGHFKLTDPDLEMHVVMVDSVDRDVVAEAALTRVGLDPAELALPEILGLERWTVLLYTIGTGRGVGVAVQQLGDATIAVILSGELGLIAAPPRDVFLTLDGQGSAISGTWDSGDRPLAIVQRPNNRVPERRSLRSKEQRLARKDRHAL